MATHECPNCGSILDLKEPTCPYCGAPNPYYEGSAPSKKPKYEPPAPRPQTTVPQQNPQAPVKQPVSFSVAVFIILLIFFWPAAIIYIIVKSIK